MPKGIDYGNGCIGNGYCFVKKQCHNECEENGYCICGFKTAINKYIRHIECLHNCQLLKCECNLDVPEFELNRNEGICDYCVDNNN